MYRELLFKAAPRPSIEIDGERYDVDLFGMDDGASPEPGDARRFLLQLGSGYMIYLYVIQAGSDSSLGHFAHSFWTKDCAVAEVEQVEHGPPARVVAERFSLPVLFPRVAIEDGGLSLPDLRVEGISFRASEGPGAGQQLELSMALSTPDGPGLLRWSHGRGYELELGTTPSRRLGDGATLRFFD